MQYTYAEWNELEAAAARYDEPAAAPMFPGTTSGVINLPMLLLIGSLFYVLFGGAIAIESSPKLDRQASIAAVAPQSAGVGGAAPSGGLAPSSGSAQPADYFPAAYPDRGRDGDGNVVTYEND